MYNKKSTIKPLKFIACALVFVLLFTSMPLSGFAALAEQAIEDSKLITVVKELEEYRTEFSKTYLKSDGSLEAVVSANAIHFSENGKWVEIDSALETAKNESGKAVLKNKKGPFNVELPTEIGNDTEISIQKAEHKISIKLLETKNSKAKKNNDKKQKAEKLTKSERKKMTAGELFEVDNNQNSAIEYSAVYDDANIRYDVTPTEVKESIVLTKAPNKKATYSYEITADGLTATLNDDNSIDFYKKGQENKGYPIFSMPAPHMFDSNDEYSYDIETTLKNKKGKFILTYKPNYEWLKSKDRAYPVTIDPTVTVNGGIQDSYTFSGEGYGDSYTGYEQQLKVGTTAWISRGDYWQTYLKFTDLPQIPYEDYRIDSAYLTLSPKATTGSWKEMELGVYELTEDWKNHQTGKVAERITFNNAPADVGYSTATASVSRGGADSGVAVGFEIAHLVEKWYDSPETNFGIKLAAHLEQNQWNDNLVFHSSRSTTGTAPYLSLTYKGVVPVTDIEILNKIERIQDIQEDYWIPEAVVYPENASDKRVIWESSDNDVLYYSSGFLEVGKPGTVTITARSVDNPEIFDKFEVEVYNIPVEGIAIGNKPENNQLCVGEEHYLSFGTLPTNASYTDLDFNTLLWQSDNTTVATVDEYGNVSAHYPGTTNISFSCDGFTDSFELTVVYAPIEKVKIVNLPENNILTINESWHLGALVYPQEETIQPRTVWVSSDPSILSVDSDGRLIPIKSGTATITASCGDKSDSCVITVNDVLVDSIALLHGINELTLIQHSTYQIDVVVMPFEATNQNVIMTSSNESIVSVSGIVATMENLGTATVYIAAADSGTVFNSITFTVVAQEEILNIPDDYHLEVGESWQFFDVPYLEIITTDTNLFTINGGTITAEQAGLTYLKIRNIYSNDIVAEVYLSIEPKNLRISGIPSTVIIGEWVDFISLTSDCGATFNPSETGWTSSNPEVFQITRGSEHEIYGHALSEGSAVIHAHVPYFGADVYFTVTVKYIIPDKISLVNPNDETDFTIWINGLFSAHATVTPENADCNYNRVMLDWYSTNDNVELIGEGYRSAAFLGKKAGTSKIYAMVDGVKSNELNVTIKAPTATITNKPTDNTIYKGGTHALGYTVDPETATVEWVSSNKNVATIDATGKITAKAVGNTTISIKATYNGRTYISDSFTLTVDYPPVESIKITNLPANNTLYVGDKHQLGCAITPSSALQYIEWKSSDEFIASIDPLTGLITAKSTGVTRITVIINNTIFDAFELKVKNGFVTVTKDEYGYAKVVFNSQDKEWLCVNYDLINGDNTEYLYSQMLKRADRNLFKNPVEKDFSYKSYTDDEIKFLYSVDPYGVAYYISKYSHQNNTSKPLSDILAYKDRMFKVLFGREPDYFSRTINGVWYKTANKENLNEVLSEAELIFGMHAIFDLNFWFDFCGNICGIFSTIIGNPKLNIDLSNKTQSQASNEIVLNVLKWFFFSATIGDTIIKQDYINFTTEQGIGEVIDNTFFGFFYNSFNITENVLNILQTICDKPSYNKELLSLYSSNVYFDIIIRTEKGEQYRLNEIELV